MPFTGKKLRLWSLQQDLPVITEAQLSNKLPHSDHVYRNQKRKEKLTGLLEGLLYAI